MTSARRFINTAPEGITHRTEFDDHLALRNLNSARITRIVISYDEHLRSITVHYTDLVGVPRGSVVGTQVELELPNGDFITKVEGALGDGVISKISFVTSKGITWGPFGHVSHANTFTWGGFGPEIGLLYFAGETYSNTHIGILRATFATYNTSPTRRAAVHYERHTDSVPDTDTPSIPQSHFATSLMSSSVKLLIGPDPAVVFYSSQDILCRLPFFRAALQGGFREASTGEITMPEDEPHTVAALIEFLYTGRYVYPFRPSSEAVDDEQLPEPDLVEGAYHVGVYATAHKYECTGLQDEALKAFMFVLRELKGIDVLRLWKCAYARDLRLGVVKDDTEMCEFRRGLPALVRELIEAHLAEIEETAVEYPMLMLDLLGLVVSPQ